MINFFVQKMNIAHNISRIQKILQSFPPAKLICVIKNRSVGEIQTALDAGIQAVGANRLQEFEKQLAAIPNLQNCEKHFIGHLQKNKAQKAAQIFDMIESVDSLELAVKLNECCQRLGRILPVLLQVNIAKDSGKSGFAPENFENVCKECRQLSALRVSGLMTIPRLESDLQQTAVHFYNLKKLFKKIEQKKIFPHFKEISMGMSGDFQVALECGATMVRIGSAVFS